MLRLLKTEGSIPAAESTGCRPDPLRALARRATAGDAQAFQTLSVALGRSVLHVIRSTVGLGHPDTEDLLQETLVALHGALPEFRGESTTLHFACRIAFHTAMNARRKALQRAESDPPLAIEQLQSTREEQSPAELLASARRRRALRRLLDELPSAQAEALGLHTMLGYTIEETADALNVPVDTVRSCLRIALSKLRQRLRADGSLYAIVTEDA